MPELREELLDVGFGRYDGVFASGDQANNKLDLERVEHVPDLRARVIEGMRSLVSAHELQDALVVPVPDGANWIGEELAPSDEQLLLLKKVMPGKDIQLRSPDHQAIINKAGSIIVVEDVPNALTTVRKALALPGIAERTIAVLGIWDRGDPATRKPLPHKIPLRSLVSEHIPLILPTDSEYWKYAA